DGDLAPLVLRAPGRRVPRCVDGPEFAFRAVLGQQISTAAARTYARGIVARFGDPVTDTRGGLTHLFPTPRALEGIELSMPSSRLRTLAALTGALASEELDLEPGCDRDRALAILARIPGVGPWTLQVIAMRALGDPDAFPLTDLGVKRAAAALGLAATP